MPSATPKASASAKAGAAAASLADRLVLIWFPPGSARDLPAATAKIRSVLEKASGGAQVALARPWAGADEGRSIASGGCAREWRMP
ncbi:hypothetical protein STHU_01120 [Allostella humosa]|nr:hypothetical protein STHU_01120 [Stella humosa]